MDKSVQIQLKFNTSSVLKLRFIILTLALLLLTFTRADAKKVPSLEVMSIPPQEAFLLEHKRQVSFGSPQRNTFNDSNRLIYALKNLKKGQDLAKTESSLLEYLYPKAARDRTRTVVKVEEERRNEH